MKRALWLIVFVASIASLFYMSAWFELLPGAGHWMRSMRAVVMLFSMIFVAISIFQIYIASIPDYWGSERVKIVHRRPIRFAWYDWLLLLGCISYLPILLFAYSHVPNAGNPTRPPQRGNGGILFLLPIVYLWRLIWNTPKARYDSEGFSFIETGFLNGAIELPLPFKQLQLASRVSPDCLWIETVPPKQGLLERVAITGNEKDLDVLGEALLRAGVPFGEDSNLENIRRRNSIATLVIGSVWLMILTIMAIAE